MNKRDAFSSSNFFWNLLSLAKVSQEIVRLHTAVVTQSVVKVCLLCMEGKKTIYICVPNWHSWGWCLLVRFGVCLCGLARLSSSPFTHIWGQGVVLVCGKLLILSRNECSKQKKFFQTSELDVSTSLICPPLTILMSWEWLNTAPVMDALQKCCAVTVAFHTHTVFHTFASKCVSASCLFCCHLLPPHTFYTFKGLMWFQT